MKQEKNGVPVTNGTSHAPSAGRGATSTDIDVCTEYNVDDALFTPAPFKESVYSIFKDYNPYRMVIILRLVVLCIFLHYRLTNPVRNAYALGLLSVICEIWFAISWILDQFPKWFPVNCETYLDRLAIRYDREGEPSQLAAVDIFVSTVDPLKEPPLVTANTVLSILVVDYPIDKVSCYVSDDGAAMLTFEGLSETSEFARKWVPFCKKYNIEPRAHEWYFTQKIDCLKDQTHPSFVKDGRAMKIGWIYGSVTEDILTGFKMHARGWRSIYCMPNRPAFKGSAPINLSGRLNQVLRWALGSVEILLSRHCPIWYGYRVGLNFWRDLYILIPPSTHSLHSLSFYTVHCMMSASSLESSSFLSEPKNRVVLHQLLSPLICRTFGIR